MLGAPVTVAYPVSMAHERVSFVCSSRGGRISYEPERDDGIDPPIHD